MTDRQTDRQTDRHTNIRNNNKAHSLRDVTQQTDRRTDEIAMAYTRYSYAVARKNVTDRQTTHRAKGTDITVGQK